MRLKIQEYTCSEIAGSLGNKVKLPFPGNEPTAYIVICQKLDLTVTQKGNDTDTGIAAQSMMLGAVEKGRKYQLCAEKGHGRVDFKQVKAMVY